MTSSMWLTKQKEVFGVTPITWLIFTALFFLNKLKFI